MLFILKVRRIVNSCCLYIFMLIKVYIITKEHPFFLFLADLVDASVSVESETTLDLSTELCCSFGLALNWYFLVAAEEIKQ